MPSMNVSKNSSNSEKQSEKEHAVHNRIGFPSSLPFASLPLPLFKTMKDETLWNNTTCTHTNMQIIT